MSSETPTHPRPIVIMGVSGAGKSTVGQALADALATAFVDADDLHPAANVAKMTGGIPLTDDDRWPWLRIVGTELARGDEAGVVIACSALKRRYRDVLRGAAPRSFFVHLSADTDVLTGRMASRPGHFMPPSLLNSQIATLEPLAADEQGLVVDSALPLSTIVDAIIDALARGDSRVGAGKVRVPDGRDRSAVVEGGA